MERVFAMKTQKYIQLTSIIAMGLLSAPAFANNNIYANSASALNINMLTDTFATYAHYGENLSDLFYSKKMYGTMTRVDEYGDDGTTLKSDQTINEKSDFLFKNVWLDAQHLNTTAHYGKGLNKHKRFYMATLGTTTKSIDLRYGDIHFGAFAGYITDNTSHTDSDGDVGGIFANYNFRNLNATALVNIGSMNNNWYNTKFTNSWTNAAFDASARFNLDKTFLVKPALYVAYTFVASDDVYSDGNIARSKDFNFFNIAPSLQFVKEIAKDWYGAISAKYVAHFGGDNDIHIAGIKKDGIDTDNYFDIGMDVEYNFQQFVFGGKVHKQIGGFDGWIGDLNAKYIF